MKVKSLIELLEDFDPEQQVVIKELLGFYDIVFLGISERQEKVEITIKTVEKKDDKGPLH
jgi:hypothetical protein